MTRLVSPNPDDRQLQTFREQPPGAICRMRGWVTGFTVTELVVVLVLIGIGLALSIGMVFNREWRETHRLSGMATSFQTTIQMARARAVARQGIATAGWVPTGTLFKVSFMEKKNADLASDTQLKTWTDLGLTPPAYGSQAYFALDYKLDGTGKEVYGQEIWFYFNPDPYDDGSVVFELNLERPPGTVVDKTDPTEYAIYFDPRGFATDKVGAKVNYTAKLVCKVKDSGGTLQVRSQMWFQITPMGRVTVMEPTT